MCTRADVYARMCVVSAVLKVWECMFMCLRVCVRMHVCVHACMRVCVVYLAY